MFDWLLGVGGGTLLAATSGNFSNAAQAVYRSAEAKSYVPTSHPSPYTYSGPHATHHHDNHAHIHNETHYHIITYINGTVNDVNYTHTHPHYPGHHHRPYASHSPDLGLTGALSSWYQLNMGLIGIGALAVVAIIGSRNFFANYLTIKKYPYGDEGYGGYDMYGTGYGGGGGGGYHRRSWYDEWYKYWYGDPDIDPNDPYKNGGPGKRTPPDPYAQHYDPYSRPDHDPRDEGDRYHKRYRRSTGDSDDQLLTNNSAETGTTLDTGHENATDSDSLDIAEGFDDIADESFEVDSAPDGDRLFEYDSLGPDEEGLSVTHCGFRLICELSRQKKRELTKDEWEILRLIKFSDLRMSTFPPGEGILSNHPALSAYKMAARVGSAGYPCETLTGRCPLPEEEINAAAKQFFKTQQNKLKKKSSR